MLFSNQQYLLQDTYTRKGRIYIYTLHTRKKVIGINNLARIIGSTHIRVDGWSGEFYIESRGTKSERTKGEYRDAEKGKHFIRFCEIIEREREAFANVGMQRRRRPSARFTRLKMRPYTTKGKPPVEERERERDERLAFKTRSTCTH